MEQFIYKFYLDMTQVESQVQLQVRPGDTMRSIVAYLRNKGNPYILTKGCYAIIQISKADGTKVVNDCIISLTDGSIRYAMTQQSLSSEGLCECEIKVYDSEGNQITSPRFTMLVMASAVSDDDVASTDEYNALTHLLGEVQRIIESGGAGLTEDEVETIIQRYLAAHPSTDEAQVRSIIESYGYITDDNDTIYDDTELRNLIASKQDTIADLASIRSGSDKGNTALQPSDIADMSNDVVALKEELLQLQDQIGQGGAGLTSAQIIALDGMFKVAGYDADANYTNAYNNFKNAFGIGDGGGIEATLTRISVVANVSEYVEGTNASDLNLTVKAHYSDGTERLVTDWTAVGIVVVGSNTFVISYMGKSENVTVTGVENPVLDTSPRVMKENVQWSSTGTEVAKTGACITEWYEFTPDLEGLMASSDYDSINGYMNTNGYAGTIKTCTTNIDSIPYSANGKIEYIKSDGTHWMTTSIGTRDGITENNGQMPRQSTTLMTSEYYPFKVSWTLGLNDINNSYAYWTTTNVNGVMPIGVNIGDIIFAGKNTKYYGLTNINEYVGD